MLRNSVSSRRRLRCTITWASGMRGVGASCDISIYINICICMYAYVSGMRGLASATTWR